MSQKIQAGSTFAKVRSATLKDSQPSSSDKIELQFWFF